MPIPPETLESQQDSIPDILEGGENIKMTTAQKVISDESS